MLNIPGNKEEANQNHIMILSDSCYNGYHPEHKYQQMLARMRGKRNLLSLLVGM
jgi:hypothetical protein